MPDGFENRPLRRGRRPFGLLGLVITTLFATTGQSAGPDAAPPQDFLLSTPQIEDATKPLAGVEIVQASTRVHTVVTTVADPLETHLTRAFDTQVSSLLRAFHAKGYVLDGYAFTWNPAATRGTDRGKTLPEDGTRQFYKDQRSRPGVLLFRNDGWREADDGAGVTYVVVFLVGESPTFGVQPEAFRRAATCAIRLNTVRPRDNWVQVVDPKLLTSDCGVWSDESVPAAKRKGRLEIIGPSFSGSMQSLALAVADIEENVDLEVQITSPSATVKSNSRVGEWGARLASESASGSRWSYHSLAASLEQQLDALCKKVSVVVETYESEIGEADDSDDDVGSGDVVILAEESTFGRGVQDILDSWKTTENGDGCNGGDDCEGGDAKGNDHRKLCARHIRVTQFPQNIASIRAERSRLTQKERASLKKLIGAQSRLLELDLSRVDETADRPIAYNRALATRSDELMLHGVFDALRIYLQPKAVAIVATDIRDRLFLLNEVRKNLPGALPVLMEMDFLSAHPDYRKISRGSVVIPNGDTLVRLNMDDDYCAFKPNQWDQPEVTAFFPFPSDYSANIFRAALGFTQSFNPECSGDRTGYCPKRPECGSSSPGSAGTSAGRANLPTPWVTTLAGFQQVDGFRSRMLAAESRLRMEVPFYVAMLVLGLAFSLMTLCLLIRLPWDWNLLRPLAMEAAVGSPLLRRGFASSLGAISLVLVVIAGMRLNVILSAEPDEMTWALPHGRDYWALAGLFLLYSAMATLGFWRLNIWHTRFGEYRDHHLASYLDVQNTGIRPSPDGGGLLLIAWIAVPVLVVVLACNGTIGVPASVDRMWPSILFCVVLLTVGAWFFTELWRQWANWSRLGMVLGGVMDTVSNQVTGKPSGNPGGWPSPMAFGERPKSPFNLRFRAEDMEVFEDTGKFRNWAATTRKLIRNEAWPFGGRHDRDFLLWQARLIAEMRLASVAIRSCAWCAVLAPTVLLAGMSVYPAPWARVQTVLAVGLIIASFALVMFVVVAAERHPLLGRMFTLHGDRLSMGGAFSALWPKLVAALVILVPVLIPGFLEWVYDLLRSINSLK